jgi:uncharacterized protein YndB with AHSA1/START domain
MPVDLIHRIGIAAPAETIYRALTTEEEMIAICVSHYIQSTRP